MSAWTRTRRTRAQMAAVSKTLISARHAYTIALRQEDASEVSMNVRISLVAMALTYSLIAR